MGQPTGTGLWALEQALPLEHHCRVMQLWAELLLSSQNVVQCPTRGSAILPWGPSHPSLTPWGLRQHLPTQKAVQMHCRGFTAGLAEFLCG